MRPGWRWSGFYALCRQDTLIDYGAFISWDAPNRSFVVHKNVGAVDGYPQIMVEDSTFRERFAVYNSGNVYMNTAQATSGTLLKDSPEVHLVGSYYKSATAHDYEAIIKFNVSADTPVSNVRFYSGEVGGSPLLMFQLTNTNGVGTVDCQNSNLRASAGLNLVAGVITYCGGITMYAGGDIDMQLTSSITNCKAIKMVGDVVAWTPLVGGTDYYTQAGSSSTITMGVDYTEKLKPGMPLRVLDIGGVEYGDTSTQLSGYSTLTGIRSSLVDSRGRLYFKVVDDTAGYFHLEIYNRSTLAAGTLIAHTATYNTTGSKVLIADNASGLAGTITIDAVGPATVAIYVEFYKWFVLHTVTAGTLTLRGPALSTAAAMLPEIWYGPVSRTVPTPLMISGEFAKTASSGLLASLCFRHGGYVNRGARARVVYFEADSNVVSASTKANVNVTVGGLPVATAAIPLTTAQTVYSTVVDVDPAATDWDYGTALEVTITQGDTTGTVDSNLGLVVNSVLE